jgi:quercetin dioxygenase-like cupin family protein
MIRTYSRRGAIAATAAGVAALTTLRRLGAEMPPAERRSRDMDIEIKRNGSRPSTKGSPDWFTGSVRVDPLFQAADPARVGAGHVTFEPGARTNWHTHPLGQTLIITSGLGWVQRDGGPIEEVRPDDVVWFPPGLKHWHGATLTTGMTHIAIQESLEGKNVDWMEKVSDEQYRK